MQRIGVVMGGTSGEREVSLRSGEAVVSALCGRGLDAKPLVLDDPCEAAALLRGAGVDVAFLALHGRYGEDGCVQGVCELLGIPYTGSSLLASALAMDKVKSKELFRLHNVPTPPYYTVSVDEGLEGLEELHGSFGFPAVVKPRGEGSSLGVRRVDDLEGLERALVEAFRYDRVALVERYVAGREVTVALLDGRVLGALEVETKAGLFDFSAKYTPGLTAYHLPARLPPTRQRNVLNLAERAARALGCTSAVRVDVLVTEGENEYILEVNTQPGMTETSLLPRIAAAAGYDFGALCEAVVAGASLHSSSPAPRAPRRAGPAADARPGARAQGPATSLRRVAGALATPATSGSPVPGPAQRTQVAIVGAGPAGLMLGHLLHRRGIDSVIVENRSRDYVTSRVRAGVLEQGTVDLMNDVGLGERMGREGMRHEGIYLAFGGARHRIDLAGLTGGRAITVYGQHEVVKDLVAAREATGRPLLFEADGVTVEGLESNRPRVRFRHGGAGHELACDFVAGCDGFHGVCRPSIPPGVLRTYEREYPFAWLGILADAAPSSGELVYCLHERGFALFSMRSPSVTRLYLQVEPDEDVANWPDERVWAELTTRLRTADGWQPNEGHITQKAVTPMRSFVAEPMRHGRLFLAGDAAHIVPPTGAKGLNLAVADVWRLAGALAEFYVTGAEARLDEYSALGARRAWRAQRFSWQMTSMLHRTAGDSDFDRRRQLAELDYLVSSRAAMTSLAENYVGVPLE